MFQSVTSISNWNSFSCHQLCLFRYQENFSRAVGGRGGLVKSRDFLFKRVTPWHLRIGKRTPNAIKNSFSLRQENLVFAFVAAILDNTRCGGAGRAVVDKMAKRGGGAKRNAYCFSFPFPPPPPPSIFALAFSYPGARLKNPRWRPISEWVAMKPPVLNRQQAG